MLKIVAPQASSPHDSAFTHVSGEAEFIDDRPLMAREVHVGVVYSPHAKARITHVNLNKALALPGVVAGFLACDLKHNIWGTIIHDQPLLAEHEVNYVGEAIAVLAASCPQILKKALGEVIISYELLPAISSIQEAVKAQSFIGSPRMIKTGDAATELEKAPHKLNGQITLRGAEHFYLENQAAIVYPLENNCLEVHCSTQAPTEVQHVVAEALGLPFHSVVCVTRRLGGGFGGKETQAAPIAAYAALVAQRLKRPARLVLNKDDDMIMTGKRNPYLINYSVGFDERGLLKALDCDFYGDGGAYADLSTSILERALAHADNAYFIEHATFRGQVCRTNFHPHTAFRGFGGPKGVAMIEHIMDEIAHFLGVDPLDIRQLNCYQGTRNKTPYGQKVENNLLPELFETLSARCDYRIRRQEINEHNQNSPRNPRGLALSAIKFGISFTTRFLNQGHALIHIHRDGSIQVATGGVEMGQGVQARIISLIALEFGIPENMIRVMPTATDKSPNTSPTAASSGTDINGSAALDACRQIKERLQALFKQLIALPRDLWPDRTAAFASHEEITINMSSDNNPPIFNKSLIYEKEKPEKNIDFITLVNQAYLSRVSLSAVGFYKVEHLDFNKLLGQGRPFLYFTQGVACSEVEIDSLSGEVKLLRSDILMDLGQPINDALDRGQVAGAFIQGVGWVTTEALYYNSQGLLLSHAPSTYKIPSIHDIPRIFNIDLVENNHNYPNLKGTKAVGEPPLMLCFSVWNAIKNALSYKHPKLVNIQVPATAEHILRVLRPEIFLRYDK